MPPTSKRRKTTTRSNKPANIKTSRGLVRIIAGTHRGRRLPVLVHEGLRPTGDRVKETLFNWLMNHIHGAVCLDMFAGSGGLGIEALSRGAEHVVFIEQDKQVAQQITDNVTTLREVDKASVLNFNAFTSKLTESLDNANQSAFDIVFIDPPFGKDMIRQSLDTLVAQNALAQEAYIYIESSHSDSYQIPDGFSIAKEIKTSQVNSRLIRKDT